VTTDGAGNWVAVWESDDNLGGVGTDTNVLVSRSTDNGANWTTAAALNSNAMTDSGWDGWPQVTTDGAGNWVAVWSSDEDLGGIGTDSDIFVSRSADNGANWTAPAALNAYAATDSESDSAPQVTTDGSGNWLAVWHSRYDIGSIGTDRDILMSSSTDNGANWTPPAALNANAATDTGDDRLAHVATDGAGEWVAVWRSDENLGGTIGIDRDIFFSRSTDNGATWTPPAVLNTNAATDSETDYEPKVTTDGAGNWVVVWNSYDDLGGTIGTDADFLVAAGTPSDEVPVNGMLGLALAAAAAAGTGVLAIRRRK
jgi:Neuraminidase (sialidase)